MSVPVTGPAPGAAPGGPQALSPRVRTMWHVLWAVGTAPFVLAGAGLAVAGAVEGRALLVAGGVAVVLACVVATVVVPRLRYARWRWQVSSEGLEVSHGVVLRVQSAIPTFRVQQIDVHQGPVERWFGLVQLRISTASAASDGVLPGIEAARAEEVRRSLLARVAADDGV